MPDKAFNFYLEAIREDYSSEDFCLIQKDFERKSNTLSEATEIFHETGLSPRQLLAALQEAKSAMEEEHISYGKPGAWEPESYKIICRALSKTSKEGV